MTTNGMHPPPGRKPGPMDPEQAQAMVAKQAATKAVEAFLQLELWKGGRPDTDNRSDEELAQAIASETRMAQRLLLINRQLLRKAFQDARGNEAAVRQAFISHARAFHDENGLVYAAWRAMGVEAEVLRLAGIYPEGQSAGAIVAASRRSPKKREALTEDRALAIIESTQGMDPVDRNRVMVERWGYSRANAGAAWVRAYQKLGRDVPVDHPPTDDPRHPAYRSETPGPGSLQADAAAQPST